VFSDAFWCSTSNSIAPLTLIQRPSSLSRNARVEQIHPLSTHDCPAAGCDLHDDALGRGTGHWVENQLDVRIALLGLAAGISFISLHQLRGPNKLLSRDFDNVPMRRH
jgi:hypothetical protein